MTPSIERGYNGLDVKLGWKTRNEYVQNFRGNIFVGGTKF